MKSFMKLSPKIRREREAEGMKGWNDWAIKNQKSIVSMGSPLGSTKKINPKGISNAKNELCAYTVVQAKSHADAAKLFVNHPHFMLFPGDSVEVMECLPIPGME